MIVNSINTRWQRAVAWLLLTAMLVPTLSGCATPVSRAGEITLVAVVINHTRLAGDGEARAVGVWRDGQAVPTRVGMTLKVGDQVATGPSAEAVIEFPSGSVLYLAPNSRGRLGSFSEFVGELFVKVKGLFEVETEFVKAGARGTAFLVRGESDGRTELIVVSDRVVLSSRTGAWAAVSLGEREAAWAYPGPPRPRVVDAGEIKQRTQWVRDLEQLTPKSANGAGAAAAVGIAALIFILGNRDKGSTDEPRPPVGAAGVNFPRDHVR